MSIKAYVGRMGSGKTYEVASVVVLGALGRGRRVVSNIAGLNIDKYREALIESGVDADKIGELVHVEHQAVIDPLFWRTDGDVSAGIASFIQPGDLLVLDEIWRFWEGFNTKVPERVMNFYRMHRHFTHPETGVACDVALITQDVMDISRKVRAVIEETYRMEKLTSVGSSKRYRVDVFQGGKTGRAPLRQLFRTYEDKYFDLYKSHSQASEGAAGPVEENIDGRGNVLKGALIKVFLPLAIVIFVAAAWFIYRFFNPKASVDQKAEQAVAEKKDQPREKYRSAPDLSDEWRVSGFYNVGMRVAYLLVGEGGRIRVLYDPPSVRFDGVSISVLLPDETWATTYSGSRGRGDSRDLLPSIGSK